MIDFFISLIQTHLLPYGGVGVFAASVIEEVIAPIPSAFVGLAAGFLFVSGPLSLNALFQLFLTVVIPIDDPTNDMMLSERILQGTETEALVRGYLVEGGVAKILITKTPVYLYPQP